MRRRPNGISTLLACQNEETTVGWSIRSFLEFSDEIIVVDNGSTDATKSICRKLQMKYPSKVKFFDVPHLRDLWENRQYALERSQYRWVVRADADFVCYTNGKNDCKRLRHELLTGRFARRRRPLEIRVCQPSVHGDFWHTVASNCDAVGSKWEMRWSQVDGWMPRVYRYWPGMRFGRKGRWEGIIYGDMGRRLVQWVNWPSPIWMHCNIKSSENYLFRSERTNWRENGDFNTFPTLASYVFQVIPEKYDTADLELAQQRYVERQILPRLVRYDPDSMAPYPDLVVQAMEESPVYRIEDGQRKYFGTTVHDKNLGDAPRSYHDHM